MELTKEEARKREKSLEGQLLWELQHGFELSPRESELIVDTVRLYYGEGEGICSGRMETWVICREGSVGKAIEDLPKVPVVVSLDGGMEDLEAYRAYGYAGLRRQRLLRISEEIVDQGGIATQEDLSRILGVSLRTVRRDVAYLRGCGITVVTRGVYSDIGPTVSHKVTIVEMYLSGFVYTEICRRTRHSAKAVKRYVETFIRVVALYTKGIQDHGEVGRYVGISERLASEYLELYFKVRQHKGCGKRIEELLGQLSSRARYSEAGKKNGSWGGGQ